MMVWVRQLAKSQYSAATTTAPPLTTTLYNITRIQYSESLLSDFIGRKPPPMRSLIPGIGLEKHDTRHKPHGKPRT